MALDPDEFAAGGHLNPGAFGAPLRGVIRLRVAPAGNECGVLGGGVDAEALKAAQADASALLRVDINYKDIREKMERIKTSLGALTSNA